MKPRLDFEVMLTRIDKPYRHPSQPPIDALWSAWDGFKYGHEIVGETPREAVSNLIGAVWEDDQ